MDTGQLIGSLTQKKEELVRKRKNIMSELYLWECNLKDVNTKITHITNLIQQYQLIAAKEVKEHESGNRPNDSNNV